MISENGNIKIVNVFDIKLKIYNFKCWSDKINDEV